MAIIKASDVGLLCAPSAGVIGAVFTKFQVVDRSVAPVEFGGVRCLCCGRLFI